MAYFKISLLTYQFLNNKTVLLQDVISEFNTQQNVYNSKQSKGILTDIDNNICLSDDEKILIADFEYLKDRKYSFCYSYDEKLSLSQNAQKTLSFNLDKFIIKENVREENPFARNIIIGSQILLIDQYNNQYFFIVKDISYDIKESNIIYKISCQDTFSYQLTRQNSGYTIDNDSSTSDFIGAKTIDWWVQNRISPDCHLNYEYLTLNQGLCELKDGSYSIFNHGDELINVKRILKEAYSVGQDKDKELFQTIPFSCSGSNANAALISLGENLDLQLKTFENINESNLLRYFWFEPKKNSDRIGGLVYSPYNSIQSFGLSHKGDSLTTILNVEGPTYEDEIITLIPALTPHFSNFIQETSWLTNYRKGMFLSQCEPQSFLLNDEKSLENVRGYSNLYYSTIGTSSELTIPSSVDFNNSVTYDKNKGILYIELFNDSNHSFNLKLNKLFTFLNFNNGELHSSIAIEEASLIDYKPSDKYRWTLNFVENNNLIASFKEGEDISEYVGKDQTISTWIGIFIGEYSTGTTITLLNFKPNLSFTREVSQEDIDFANAAEECPWLENKLIDFNYFLETKMISPEEYIDLTNILLNDLRIINGKIMFYSKAYYQALHEKTKELAALVNQLDLLGATAEADILSTIRTEGSINEKTNISSFDNAYTTTLIAKTVEESLKILNYDEILSDYFNKLFNAEQRFLKNIKNFADYFNSTPSTWLDKEVAFYKYILDLTSDNYDIEATTDATELIDINDIQYIEVGEKSGVPFYPIYDKDSLKQYTPVTAQNYKNYYIKNPVVNGDSSPVEDDELFEENWGYYTGTPGNYTKIATKSIKEAILNDLTEVKYRDYTETNIYFSNLSSALTNLLKLDPEIEKDYKEKFPVKEIYYLTSEDKEKNFSFVNEETYGNFYQIEQTSKLSSSNKWVKGLANAKRDIYGNEHNDYDSISRNYIYCSTIIPTIPYDSNNAPDTIGISFDYASESNKGFYFKESTFFTAVTKTTIARKNSTYKIYEIPSGMNENDITNIVKEYCGAISYWPLYQEFVDLNFDNIEIKDRESWETILNGKASPQSDYIWQRSDGSNKLFFIIEIRKYSLADYNGTYEESKTYCDKDDNEIDFYQQKLPTSVNAAVHIEKPYIHPTGDYDLEEEYYQIDPENAEQFERVYTIAQLKQDYSSNYKYRNPKKLILSYLTPRETKIQVTLSKLNIEKDSSERITNFIKEKSLVYNLYFTKDETHTEPLDYYKGDHTPATIEDLVDRPHTEIYQEMEFSIGTDVLEFKLTKSWEKEINISTNGNLWYQCTQGEEFRNQASAISIAATIEAELESYWQQAYNASLYCRYFLPESWQPRYNKEINYFANDVVNVITQNGTTTVSLSNKYIPIVSIYKKDGKTVLPKYYISKRTSASENSTVIDSNTIAENLVISEMINYLGENIEEFVGVEAGTTSYYYIEKKNEKTGCTWSRFMSVNVDPQYSEYSGIYDLSYRLFKKNYKDFGITEYEYWKQQQQDTWQTLYNRFGYLMLENNYKDENATTSAELMILAKNAFKDYSAPERQYNITVIDSTALKNYTGGEIRIGDGIQIDAQAYYNEYDQIFKSLSQYLFVTDISYTLRSPTDISLTVNTIKYQDKLIQRLARLIK